MGEWKKKEMRKCRKRGRKKSAEMRRKPGKECVKKGMKDRKGRLQEKGKGETTEKDVIREKRKKLA